MADAAWREDAIPLPQNGTRLGRAAAAIACVAGKILGNYARIAKAAPKRKVRLRAEDDKASAARGLEACGGGRAAARDPAKLQR
jgi:hypothetical protein